MFLEEVEITFRYTCLAWPLFGGGFEVFFGGVQVGCFRGFKHPFFELMIADPGVYEIELLDRQGILKRESLTKFKVRIPSSASCQIDLTLDQVHSGRCFWQIPVLKVLQ